MPPDEGAGYLFLPGALKWEPSAGKGDKSFEEALMRAMTEAVEDPSSASARLPYIVAAPPVGPWTVPTDAWRGLIEDF